jgi:hypothetical protein
MKYRRATEAHASVLSGIGIKTGAENYLTQEVADSLWGRYLGRLRTAAGSAIRWPLEERDAVQRHLDAVADMCGLTKMIWLVHVDSNTVGVEVQADLLLRAAVTYFVSFAADLMLTSPDAANGICVELNHLPERDEFEVVAWGALSRA